MSETVSRPAAAATMNLRLRLWAIQWRKGRVLRTGCAGSAYHAWAAILTGALRARAIENQPLLFQHLIEMTAVARSRANGA